MIFNVFAIRFSNQEGVRIYNLLPYGLTFFLFCVCVVCLFVCVFVCTARRKRLRDVCGEEHCWRAQANLLLSYCYLHQALGRLKAESGEDVQGRQGDGGEEEEEEEEEEEKGRGGDREFRFDQSGVILEGVIPVFTPCVAGKGNKVSHLTTQPWTVCLFVLAIGWGRLY